MKPVRAVLVWFTDRTAVRMIRKRCWALFGVIAVVALALEAAGIHLHLPHAESGLGRFTWYLVAALAAFLGFVGHLGSHFAHEFVNDRLKDRLGDASSFFRNEHLTELVGQAIRMVLLEASEATSPDAYPVVANPVTRTWLRKHAVEAVETWILFATVEAPKQNSAWGRFSEANLWTFVRDPHHLNLDDWVWREFLKHLGDGHRIPFAGTEDEKCVINRLNARIGTAIWEGVKNDYTREGRAAKAMELVCLQELLRRGAELKVDTPEFREAVADTQRLLKDLVDQTGRMHSDLLDGFARLQREFDERLSDLREKSDKDEQRRHKDLIREVHRNRDRTEKAIEIITRIAGPEDVQPQVDTADLLRDTLGRLRPTPSVSPRRLLPLTVSPVNKPLELVLDDYRAYPRLLLAGEPGAGKTTGMRCSQSRIYDRLCKEYDEGAPTSGLMLPLWVELGQLRTLLSCYGDSVPQGFLAWRILVALGHPSAQLSTSSRELVRFLSETDCQILLYLDGLNEIEAWSREIIRDLTELDGTLRSADRSRLAGVRITSRALSLDPSLEDRGYVRADILPLDGETVTQVLREQLPSSSDHACLFQNLSTNARRLFSNPLRLVNGTAWLATNLATQRPEAIQLSSGSLLQFCVDQQLERIEHTLADRETLLAVLARLARHTVERGPYFTAADISSAEVRESINPDRFNAMLSLAKESGLLIRWSARCWAFQSHSMQQYFAAEWMREHWQIEEYARMSLWQEPLALLAGVVDSDRREEILHVVKGQPVLHAYVLANLDLPAKDRRLVHSLSQDFLRTIRFWGVWIGILQSALVVAWISSLLVSAWFLAFRASTPVIFLSIGVFVLGPFGLYTLVRLQNEYVGIRLPRRWSVLAKVFRILQDRNAPAWIRRGVHELLDARLAHGDPRRELLEKVAADLAVLERVRSYLTVDEALDLIRTGTFPSEILDVSKLDTTHVEKLIMDAEQGTDGSKGRRAIEALERVCAERSDWRCEIITALRRLATSTEVPYRTRQAARGACLTIGVKPPRRPGWRSMVLSWVRWLLSRTRPWRNAIGRIQ